MFPRTSVLTDLLTNRHDDWMQLKLCAKCLKNKNDNN